jgi:hypothetical protein
MPPAKAKVDYEAYPIVKSPNEKPYMNNVLLAFAAAIPEHSYPQCTSKKYVTVPDILTLAKRQDILREFVTERLVMLADYEYRGWINGSQPFVTPRELQLWRLRQFFQYVWFWSLPDDQDLAVIFNLTQRRAANLAADFVARFRKTMVYPVQLRRLYQLINETAPHAEKPHPRHPAKGFLYKVPSLRFVDSAKYLMEDIRAVLPQQIMVAPEVWPPRDQKLMWIDREMVDVMKTNEELRLQLYTMYGTPE